MLYSLDLCFNSYSNQFFFPVLLFLRQQQQRSLTKAEERKRLSTQVLWCDNYLFDMILTSALHCSSSLQFQISEPSEPNEVEVEGGGGLVMAWCCLMLMVEYSRRSVLFITDSTRQQIAATTACLSFRL